MANPVAAADTFTFTQNSNGTYTGTSVLANDTDADANTLTAVKDFNPAYGTVTLNANGTFTYTLGAWAVGTGFNGTDTFYYHANDGTGDSNVVPVTINITQQSGGNQPPLAMADNIALTQNVNGTYSGTSVLANDSDPNSNPITAALDYNPGYGSVTLNSNGTFTYTLGAWATTASGFTGTDTFYYHANDGQANSQIVAVTVTLPQNNNPAPVAAADTYNNVSLSNGVYNSTISVLANDTDNNPIIAVKQWEAGWGTINLSSNGQFTYTLASWATAANGFAGTDEFYYYATDGLGQSAITKVSLTNITNGTITPGSLVVTQSNGNTAVTEGAAAGDTITVALVNAPTANVTVQVGGEGDVGVSPQTLTFTPQNWQAAQTVTITAVDDQSVEGPETHNVTFATQSADTRYNNLTVPAIAVAVTDNDQPPLPTLSINDVTLAESNGGTTAFTFTVTLSVAAASQVSVNYATADGTATVGSDYSALTGSVVFGPGETSKQVTVLISGDLTVEPNETFNVNLSNPTGATIADGQGVGTITNDDQAPLPTISINDVSQAEGNAGTTAFTFTVTLSAAAASDVSVNYATANGTATAGSDYTAASGTVTFAPGETSKTITVNVTGDGTTEPNETFNISLTGPVGATIADSQSVGTITNDDADNTPVNITVAAGATGGQTYTGGAGSNDTINLGTIAAAEANATGTQYGAIITLDPAKEEFDTTPGVPDTPEPMTNVYGTRVSGSTITGIENVTINSTAKETFLGGNDSNNVLNMTSTQGGGQIYGYGGNDTITFTTSDLFEGVDAGEGNDTVTLISNGDISNINDSRNSGDDTYILGTGIQNVYFSTAGQDQTTPATNGTDIIQGFAVGSGTDQATWVEQDRLAFMHGRTEVQVMGGNTVFTTFDNDTNAVLGTVTVQGVTNMLAGRDYYIALSADEPPVSRDDAYTIVEGVTLTVGADQSVLLNDDDGDANATQPLTATLGQTTQNGTLSFNSDGAFSYTPNANFSGSDLFTYYVSDGTHTNSGVFFSSVTITVTGENDPPNAVDDTYNVAADRGVIFDPRTNDTDVDSFILTAMSTSSPAHGLLMRDAYGRFVYNADGTFQGTDSFTYEVSDGQGGTDTATVTFSIGAPQPHTPATNVTLDFEGLPVQGIPSEGWFGFAFESNDGNVGAVKLLSDTNNGPGWTAPPDGLAAGTIDPGVRAISDLGNTDAEGGSLVMYRMDQSEFDFTSAYLTGPTGSNGTVTISSFKDNILVNTQQVTISNTPTQVADDYSRSIDKLVISHPFTALVFDNGTFVV